MCCLIILLVRCSSKSVNNSIEREGRDGGEVGGVIRWHNEMQSIKYRTQTRNRHFGHFSGRMRSINAPVRAFCVPLFSFLSLTPLTSPSHSPGLFVHSLLSTIKFMAPRFVCHDVMFESRLYIVRSFPISCVHLRPCVHCISRQICFVCFSLPSLHAILEWY